MPLHFGGRYIFASFSAAQGGAIIGVPVAISSIQAVALGLPAAYVQGYGDPRTDFGYSDLSLFAQYDWRMSDRLAVKLGLRYQNQFWPDFEYNVRGAPPFLPTALAQKLTRAASCICAGGPALVNWP